MEREEVLQKTGQASAPNHSQLSYFHCFTGVLACVGDTTLAKTPHSITKHLMSLPSARTLLTLIIQDRLRACRRRVRTEGDRADGKSDGITRSFQIMPLTGHSPGTGIVLIPTQPHQYLPLRSITGNYFETSRSQYISKQKMFLYCFNLLIRKLSQVTPVSSDGRLSLEEVLQLLQD